MFSVFASFTGQDDPIIKMFDVGLAAAVLIDALVVRGRSNWWVPGWLDRWLPHVDLESLPEDGDPAPLRTRAPEPAGT